jgi:hypothetical protein
MTAHLPNSASIRTSKLSLGLLFAAALAASLYAGDAQAAKRKKSKVDCNAEVQMSRADELRCHAGKTHYSRSSNDETRAERERRLKRECKGRPNAGMCLGFAS